MDQGALRVRAGEGAAGSGAVIREQIQTGPPFGGASSYEVTLPLLVLHRNATARKTVLDRSVMCVVGNGLDDVLYLLRQPAATDGGHRSTIHLIGYGKVFDYQRVHFDSPKNKSVS
jgi:hypothetical protein